VPEFWCKRAATKLKVDPMEIRSIDNRNPAKAKEKSYDVDLIRYIESKSLSLFFKYAHDSRKYDFPLHCNPKDLSDLGLYKKGEELCHDDADIYSNLGKICILPSYPLSSFQFDINKCDE